MHRLELCRAYIHIHELEKFVLLLLVVQTIVCMCMILKYANACSPVTDRYFYCEGGRPTRDGQTASDQTEPNQTMPIWWARCDLTWRPCNFIKHSADNYFRFFAFFRGLFVRFITYFSDSRSEYLLCRL